MKNGYNYDALNNTLTISASFAKKASKVGSLEYNIILKMRHDFPNLTIQQEAKRKCKKSITFGQMEEFIAQHRDADELMRIFEKVKKLSRVQPMPYDNGSNGVAQQNTSRFLVMTGISKKDTIIINDHITTEVIIKGNPFFCSMTMLSLNSSKFMVSSKRRWMVRIKSMKYLLEGVLDLLLNILYIQPQIDFFLLLIIGFPFHLLPTFFHTLLFDVWYRVIDHFRAHSPELNDMLLVSCLCPNVLHLGYLLFEVIVRICHSYPSVSLLLSKEVKSSLFI